MSESVGLALGPQPHDSLELALLRAGHTIAWRAHTRDETLSLLADRAPDVLLLADDPELASPEVVGAADLLGTRTVLVVRETGPSAAARRLGVIDTITIAGDAPPDVSVIEPGRGPGLVDSPPPRGDALPAPGGMPSVPDSAPPASPVPADVPMSSGSGGHAGSSPPAAFAAEPAAPARIPFHPMATLADGEAPRRLPPRVVAVWGPTGAPGRTTFAIALAAELALRGQSVALVDADTYGGTIAPALGLLDEAPGFAAACRLAGAGSLSTTELDRVSQPLSSETGIAADRLRVLTGIGRPHRWPELSAERVTAALEACRGWREVVVVDTGFNLEADEELSSDLFAPRRNAATVAALRAADDVVAIGTADPLGLARFLRTYDDLCEVAEPARVHVVINRVRSSVLGLDPDGQVRHTLDRFGGIREAVLIDNDPAGTDAALLRAQPLPIAAPRSPMRASVAEVADALGYRTPATAGRRSLFSRRRTG